MVVTLGDGTTLVVGAASLKIGAMEFACRRDATVSQYETQKVMGADLFTAFQRWMDGKTCPINGFFGRDIRNFMFR